MAVLPGEAEQNVLAYFISMPPSLRTLASLLRLRPDANYLMREGALSCKPLWNKCSKLLVAVLAADYSSLASLRI